jgi:hypothetical protein
VLKPATLRALAELPFMGVIAREGNLRRIGKAAQDGSGAIGKHSFMRAYDDDDDDDDDEDGEDGEDGE